MILAQPLPQLLLQLQIVWAGLYLLDDFGEGFERLVDFLFGDDESTVIILGGGVANDNNFLNMGGDTCFYLSLRISICL